MIIQVVYLLPCCTSQSPASGDAVLIGHALQMQEINKDPALKKLLTGSSKHFVILVADAGFQERIIKNI